MTQLSASVLDFQLESHANKPETLCILDNLLNYLNSTIPDLHAKIIGRMTKSPFVHISHQFWQNFTEFNYAPTFYLIARVNCDELLNLNTLNLQLSAYNGKLLQTFSEQYQISNSTIVGNIIQQSHLLASFIRGEIRLCRGKFT